MESLFTYTTMTLFQCYKIVLIYSLHINFFKKIYYYENNLAYLMLKNLMFLWGILNCTTINQNWIDFATFDKTIFDAMLTIGQIHRNQFDVLHFQWLPFMREKNLFEAGIWTKGHWVRSVNATSVLFIPPAQHAQHFNSKKSSMATNMVFSSLSTLCLPICIKTQPFLTCIINRYQESRPLNKQSVLAT